MIDLDDGTLHAVATAVASALGIGPVLLACIIGAVLGWRRRGSGSRALLVLAGCATFGVGTVVGTAVSLGIVLLVSASDISSPLFDVGMLAMIGSIGGLLGWLFRFVGTCLLVTGAVYGRIRRPVDDPGEF